MSKTIVVSAEDQLTFDLVTRSASKFDANVIPVQVSKNVDWEGQWTRCDALMYDEDQLGGDTVEVLEHIKWSFLVPRDEVNGWESNGLLGRIEEFLGQALNGSD
jgi:hypothetical protein